MRNISKLFAAVIFCTVGQNAWAGWNTSVGIEAGGDELAFAIFENGAKQTMDAGNGFFLNFGYQLQTPGIGDRRFETALSFGYKSDFITAANGNINFQRFNASVMQYFSSTNGLRFGAGLTGHFHNTFSIKENDRTIFESDVNNALGAVVSVDYILGAHNYIGLRYTMLDYTDLGEQFNGNSIGFYFTTHMK